MAANSGTCRGSYPNPPNAPGGSRTHSDRLRSAVPVRSGVWCFWLFIFPAIQRIFPCSHVKPSGEKQQNSQCVADQRLTYLPFHYAIHNQHNSVPKAKEDHDHITKELYYFQCFHKVSNSRFKAKRIILNSRSLQINVRGIPFEPSITSKM